MGGQNGGAGGQKSYGYQDQFLPSDSSVDTRRRREVDGKVAGQGIEGVLGQRLELEVGQDDRPAREDQPQVVGIFLFVDSLRKILVAMANLAVVVA